MQKNKSRQQVAVFYPPATDKGVCVMSPAIQEISTADAQLTDLLKQIEAGHEVILTKNGCRIARLVPEPPSADIRAQRRAALEKFQHIAFSKMPPGPDAACSQDFLYDEDGLPG